MNINTDKYYEEVADKYYESDSFKECEEQNEEDGSMYPIEYRGYHIKPSTNPGKRWVWEHPEKADVDYDDGYFMIHQGLADTITEAREAIDFDIDG